MPSTKHTLQRHQRSKYFALQLHLRRSRSPGAPPVIPIPGHTPLPINLLVSASARKPLTQRFDFKLPWSSPFHHPTAFRRCHSLQALPISPEEADPAPFRNPHSSDASRQQESSCFFFPLSSHQLLFTCPAASADVNCGKSWRGERSQVSGH